MSTPLPSLFGPLKVFKVNDISINVSFLSYVGKQLYSLMKYARAWFLSAVFLSDKKVEFWNPTVSYPAILKFLKTFSYPAVLFLENSNFTFPIIDFVFYLIKNSCTYSYFSDIDISGLTR